MTAYSGLLPAELQNAGKALRPRLERYVAEVGASSIGSLNDSERLTLTDSGLERCLRNLSE